MKKQNLKTIALLLCLAVLFTTVLPQVYARPGSLECYRLLSAISAAYRYAQYVCSHPQATELQCAAAILAYYELVDRYNEECRYSGS